jgi:hypothetical protein
MSTKRKRDYIGTIVPAVATLINRCIANQKKYRLITEEDYEENPRPRHAYNSSEQDNLFADY